MYDFDSPPFRFMRFRYGVPILLLLQTTDKMHQNQIRKELGAEIAPIKNALDFMVVNGLVTQIEMPEHGRIKAEFALTPSGRKLAQLIGRCANEMLYISSPNHAKVNNITVR